MEIRTRITVPDDTIVDLLIDALNTGSSRYWVSSLAPNASEETLKRVVSGDVCLHIEPRVKDGEKMPQYYGTPGFINIEKRGEQPWHVDRSALERGLQIMADKHPHHIAKLIDGDFDAETSDVFFNCVCFGDIVFS